MIGISCAINYFVFSSAKPVKKLTRITHNCTIYDPYFIISLLCQGGLHIYGMYYMNEHIARKYQPEYATHLMPNLDQLKLAEGDDS